MSRKKYPELRKKVWKFELGRRTVEPCYPFVMFRRMTWSWQYYEHVYLNITPASLARVLRALQGQPVFGEKVTK